MLSLAKTARSFLLKTPPPAQPKFGSMTAELSNPLPLLRNNDARNQIDAPDIGEIGDVEVC